MSEKCSSNVWVGNYTASFICYTVCVLRNMYPVTECENH